MGYCAWGLLQWVVCLVVILMIVNSVALIDSLFLVLIFVVVAWIVVFELGFFVCVY